jgi:diketogulonate reductase-like aldo/keto reductase
MRTEGGLRYSARRPSLKMAAAVGAVADATPAQVALAWLLSKGDDIVPIPGTKRTARVENYASDGIELSPEQIQRLDNLTPAAGGHHNEEQMRLLER